MSDEEDAGRDASPDEHRSTIPNNQTDVSSDTTSNTGDDSSSIPGSDDTPSENTDNSDNSSDSATMNETSASTESGIGTDASTGSTDSESVSPSTDTQTTDSSEPTPPSTTDSELPTDTSSDGGVDSGDMDAGIDPISTDTTVATPTDTTAATPTDTAVATPTDTTVTTPTDTTVATPTDTAMATDTSASIPTDTAVNPCLAGYDSASPSLRVLYFSPTEPPTLADGAVVNPIQENIDSEALTILLDILGISGDGNYPLRFGAGMSTSSDDTYQFLADPQPSNVDVTLVNDSFQSSDTGADITLSLPLDGTSMLEIPLREAVITGTFDSIDRCAIGGQDSNDDWVAGGQITGLVTVDDAAAISITYGTLTITLCELLAAENILTAIMAPSCDPNTWTNHPNAETADENPAWIITADYAAGAVLLDE